MPGKEVRKGKMSNSLAEQLNYLRQINIYCLEFVFHPKIQYVAADKIVSLASIFWNQLSSNPSALFQQASICSSKDSCKHSEVSTKTISSPGHWCFIA